jgi:hypothetical protein
MFRFNTLYRWKQELVNFYNCKYNNFGKNISYDDLQLFLNLLTTDIKRYYNIIVVNYMLNNTNKSINVINLMTIINRTEIGDTTSFIFDVDTGKFGLLFVKFMKEKNIIYPILQKSLGYVSQIDLDYFPKMINYEKELIVLDNEDLTKVLTTNGIFNVLLYYSCNLFLKLIDSFIMDMPTHDSIDKIFTLKILKKYHTDLSLFDFCFVDIKQIVDNILREQSIKHLSPLLMNFITTLNQ